VIPGCDLATTVRRANQIGELIASQTNLHASRSNRRYCEYESDGNRVVHQFGAALAQCRRGLYQAKRDGRKRVEQILSPAIAIGTGS